METSAHAEHIRGKVGIVIHSPALYDFFVSLVMLGRESVLREKMLQLARVTVGESVLDVGSGTGTLAIAARKLTGPTGSVQGVEASPEMIARAQAKARKAGVDVVFRQGAAQSLPCGDARFDAVLATMMLHHIPRSARPQVFQEMRRVLKPGGRAFIVDFARPGKKSFNHLHRHGYVDVPEVTSMLREAGLDVLESGAVGWRELHFILAVVPAGN